MAFSFRFYGRRPAEFAEGANEGYRFSVQFQRVPTDEQWEALGFTFASLLRSGPADPSGAWRTSDRFAVFDVGERWMSGYGFLGVVADFFEAAHRIVPIADVVFHNARDGEGAWSRWSLSQSAPDAGPEGAGGTSFAPFARAVDSALPPLEVNAAVAAGRGRAQTMQSQTAVDDAIIVSTPGKLGVQPSGIAVPETQDFFDYPPETEARFALPTEPDQERRSSAGGVYFVHAPGDRPLRCAPASLERPLALVGGGPNRNTISLAWLDAQGQRKAARFPEGTRDLAGPVLSHDGSHAIMWTSWQAYVIDLSSGDVRKFCERIDSRLDGSRFVGAAFSPEGDWIIATEKRVRLFAAGSGEELDVLKASGDRVLTLRQGEILCLRGKQLTFIGVANKKLKKLGSLSGKLPSPFETPNGRVALAVNGQAYEVTYLDALYEQFASGKKAKPKAKSGEGAVKKKPASAALKRMAKVGRVDEPSKYQRVTEPALCAALEVPTSAHVVTLADGAALALHGKDNAYMPHAAVHVRVAENAPVVRLALQTYGADLTPDRKHLLLAQRGALDLCDVAQAAKPVEVFRLPSKEQGKGVMSLPENRVAFLSSKGLYLLQLDLDARAATLLHLAKLSNPNALLPLHDLGVYVVTTKVHPYNVYVGGVSEGKTRWLFKEKLYLQEARRDGDDVLVGTVDRKPHVRLTGLGKAAEVHLD